MNGLIVKYVSQSKLSGVNILPRVPIKYRGTINLSWGRILQVLNLYQAISEKAEILPFKLKFVKLFFIG